MAGPPTSTDDPHPVPATSGAVERTAPPAIAARRRRRLDGRLLAASLAIAVGLVLVAIALLRAQTDDPRDDLPDAIEDVSPVPGAVQVLAQTQVIADLAEGYAGQLTIDRTELETVRLDELGNANAEPGTQVDVPVGVVVFEPGNGTLTFTPGEGGAIERFGPGLHTATLLYWPVEDGPGSARSYSWTFEAI